VDQTLEAMKPQHTAAGAHSASTSAARPATGQHAERQNAAHSARKLRPEDWMHRLHVLWAWRQWRSREGTADRDDGATYRAVLDGCAVTARALCDILGVGCQFRDKVITDGHERPSELLDCCDRGKSLVEVLDSEEQRCLLVVLYLGNRAVAHPKDGQLDHKVTALEMTTAINTVLAWLAARAGDWPALGAVNKEFLCPIK
jgi:hypothetical protein